MTNGTTPDPMTSFVNLSALLTGISAGKLNPFLDPVNIKQAYFNTAQSNGGATFTALLDVFNGALAKKSTPEQIADLIFNQSGKPIRYLARSIMLAWYLGSWYDPLVLQKYDNPSPPGAPAPSTVISADAYTQGWVWNVAQAHPMGYSNFQFGYWAQNPPALTDFIGATS